MKNNKVLLHTCCAPCTTYTAQHLQQAGWDVTGYFYNPNIHPYQEFKRRLTTLKEYVEKTNLPVVYNESYDLEKYLEGVMRLPAEARQGEGSERCLFCYDLRLGEVARYAAENNFEYFTTTLLISPYQDQIKIKKVGEENGNKYTVKFLFEDFSRGYKESIAMSKEHNLYRQPYCGCIFSEKERFY